MLKLVRSLIQRRGQFQRELATLQPLPRIPLDQIRLRWITETDIAAAFSPKGSLQPNGWRSALRSTGSFRSRT